ncbi:hypothetical protein [Microbispora bryophytorum]|uniref:Secreted protein n=1 Tax=Microbispora bryophytorum TaxID=1460882 RepID=A0A8H9H498_9ACTN|nr:hypothetical protein [Microbispora bryophytorum]MBD3137602.1 hypothetical protein [Microbispora bryophytorum]TQS05895.1 hypothetical protein FLX07_16115 [Microbispora bryophytorum]GGO19950.1 hypothetical protein GCM10011574_45940 [Microbispora bryophytorum]
MRRAAGYLIAWCGATALAVGVSWLGVRDVLRSAILDEAPLAPVVAVVAHLSASPGVPTPTPQGTSGGGASKEPTEEPPEEPSGEPSEKPHGPAGSAESSPAAQQRKAAGGESLHTFTLEGGRATIAVTSADCRVVTATPNDGYEVKVWEADQWLRVAFLRDTHESSAFCVWNALPPRLDTYEN